MAVVEENHHNQISALLQLVYTGNGFQKEGREP